MLNILKYELENYLAFSLQSWLAVQQAYNSAIFPVQIVGLVVGAMVAWMAVVGAVTLWQRRWMLACLGVAWVLVGSVYFLRYLSVIDWTAVWAGWVFIGQGAILLLSAMTMSMSAAPGAYRQRLRVIVLTNLALALFGYPFLQWCLGYQVTALDWFGSGVVSTILMTAAICLLQPRRFLWFMAIPLLWSLRQFSISWPLDDIAGMLLLPWLTLCMVVAVVDQQSSRSPDSQ